MYFAKVGKIEKLEAIPGADRIQVAYIYGTPCIVPITSAVNDLGILFPEGGQLAPWYLSRNNLYRDSSKNKDNSKTGFFEDKGRVRAQPFMKVRSEALFMPLASLGGNYSALQDGEEVTAWNGEALCWKYVVASQERTSHEKRQRQPRFKISVPDFHEHQDTAQWRFNSARMRADAENWRFTITEKYHGTSGRWGFHYQFYCPVERYLENKIPLRYPRLRKFAFNLVRKFRFWSFKEDCDYVVGSRRVVMHSPKEGYHGSEQFRFDILERLKPHLKLGMTMYGEIVGWHPGGKPFMTPHDLRSLKDKRLLATFKGKPEMIYAYGADPGTYDFIIYRITLFGIDLPHEEIEKISKTFLAGGETKINFLTPMRLSDTLPDENTLQDFVTNYGTYVSYSDKETLLEGIVIRADNIHTNEVRFFKEKTFPFKVLEGIAKEDEPDAEDNS